MYISDIRTVPILNTTYIYDMRVIRYRSRDGTNEENKASQQDLKQNDHILIRLCHPLTSNADLLCEVYHIFK